MTRSLLTLMVVLSAGAVLCLADCGRRGKLEPPPEQQIAPRQSAAKTPSALGPGNKAPPDPGYVKPKKPFVLDPLLN